MSLVEKIKQTKKNKKYKTQSFYFYFLSVSFSEAKHRTGGVHTKKNWKSGSNIYREILNPNSNVVEKLVELTSWQTSSDLSPASELHDPTPPHPPQPRRETVKPYQSRPLRRCGFSPQRATLSLSLSLLALIL